MPTPNPFSEAKPLGYFIEHVAKLPDWTWLYVAANDSEITLTTVCHPTARNSRDMSEDEILEFEAYAERAGLCPLFNRDQLQDIVENLRQQRAQFTPQECVAAIDFYWRHDAFIDLSTPRA